MELSKYFRRLDIENGTEHKQKLGRNFLLLSTNILYASFIIFLGYSFENTGYCIYRLF
jgi:hypothetical protein